ncbi:retrotransposon hot spot (RHS) protein, putative, partial [Trypanosoma cruzi]
MSGRPESVQGGNVESQSSNVSQGGRRRTRSEFEGDTDYSSTTRRRLEGMYRLQWTMSSTLEDILLEGTTNRANMKLNDFLRSNLGEEWVVERNGNVTMGNFVQNPETFIKKKGLLHTIKASPSYQELEREMKRELEERKILLEAIYKLHHEGVDFLEQWRDYEGKDTVTPLARRKLNRVLTQLLREESREAEERAVREEHVGFALTTTIRDVLFRGRVRVMDVKLNDFLTLEFEGRGILRANRNVLLRGFFKDPTRYIHDAGVLGEMQATDAYLRMEGTVRDEMYLEEAVRRLHHEGVFFLEQWREYQGKDTLTLHVCGKLDGVLTQVERAEKARRDAEEEKARREKEERARLDQQRIKFNLTLSIKDAIFQGRARVHKMKLNKFLMRELDGRGVVDANRNVLLKEFFKDPARYFRDAGVLGEIQATDAYAEMEGAVREEMDMEKDLRRLYKNGVSNLFGWLVASAEIRASVLDITKSFLDAALEEARKPTTTIAPIKMEGLYESVYNARWHHVVEVSGGEGTGMEVKEGKPEQSWKYKKAGYTLEEDDGVRKSGEVPPRLMVLTSDDGWPYTMNGPHRAGNDLFVNCEVERVWQIVKRGLTKWFSNFDLILNPSPVPHLLVGTPGIGKSMNAGSYLLYQLLHYDVEKLQVVVHCFGSTAYVFDKTSRTVTKYMGNKTSKSVLGGLWQRGMKGYIIYDVAKKGTPPDPDIAPPTKWGMIVVSSPNLSNYDKWANQSESVQIVMNCPEKDDIKAMCAWMKQNRQLAEEEEKEEEEEEEEEEAGEDEEEEADYWKKVKGRMDKVGPLLRYVFDQRKYKSRLVSCRSTINKMVLSDTQYYSVLGTEKMCEGNHVSHKLVRSYEYEEKINPNALQ